MKAYCERCRWRHEIDKKGYCTACGYHVITGEKRVLPEDPTRVVVPEVPPPSMFDDE